MKKIASVILAVMFCLSLALPAAAEQLHFISVGDRLSDSELSELESRAEMLYERGGIGASCLILDSLDGYTVPEYVDSVYAEQCPADDAVVLVHDVDSGEVYLYYLGNADSAVYGYEEELIGAYNDSETYFDGIYRYINAAARVIVGDTALDAGLSSDSASYRHPARLVDDSHLLSSDEAAELTDILNEISERRQFDVVVVTVDSLSSKSAMAFADDYYDYGGYGMGADRDGVLLLVSMEERDWYISTRGYGITAITDAGRRTMSSYFVPKLSDGEYFEAFKTYAELCDEYVTHARNDRPYDNSNLDELDYSVPLTAGDWLTAVLVSIVIGIVVALIVCSILKGKLKTVKMKRGASDYTVEDSLEVTQSAEFFLYSQVIRTAKPKNDDDGGSSTHTSSSGASHGGGGGKF